MIPRSVSKNIVSRNPMRIVGNKDWTPTPASPLEALQRGAELDALAAALVPDFQRKGTFRGTPDFFARMDEEKNRQLRAWLNEHTRPAA